MPDITITLTDAENKSMEYIVESVQEWADNAVTNRARIAGDEIIEKLINHCNSNNITIATGRDAQITQAYTLGVVDTVANINANTPDDPS